MATLDKLVLQCDVLLRKYDLRIFAVIISCLLSLLVIISNPLLNEDAYAYLGAAELYLNEGVAATLAVYGWVGYSIIIALMSKVLPLGLVNCAYLLNIVLYGILVYSFISLVIEYRRNLKLTFFAAAVILIFPYLNELRGDFVRDFGFWAFSINALLQLVRFNRYHRLRYALAWCLAIFASLFFRIEAILLLMFAPFALLLPGMGELKRQLKSFFLIQSIVVSIMLLVLLVTVIYGIDISELVQFAYRTYIPRLSIFFTLISDTANQLNIAIFDSLYFPGHSNHSYALLIFSYFYILIAALVSSLGAPFTILFLYGFFTKKITLPFTYTGPIIFFAAISLASLLIFLLIMHFLTHRYTLLIALIVLSFLPFYLESIYNHAVANNKVKRFTLVFGFIGFYLLIDSLISFGHSKSFVEDAIDWTQSNLNEGDQLYTNERAIAYFSGLVDEYYWIEADPQGYINNISDGEYIALYIRYSDTQLVEQLEQKEGLELMANFANKRNDQVRIYSFNP